VIAGYAFAPRYVPQKDDTALDTGALEVAALHGMTLRD